MDLSAFLAALTPLPTNAAAVTPAVQVQPQTAQAPWPVAHDGQPQTCNCCDCLQGRLSATPRKDSHG